jgi:hypothetical protein
VQLSSRDPVNLFDQSIAPPVQSELLRTIKQLYPVSYRATVDLVRTPEVGDLYPKVRRGIIEGGARSVAEKHGLSTKIETNRSGNTHTVIQSGNFFLTISQVCDPSDMVRHAAFRAEDALHNHPLFAALTEDEPPESEAQYNAILKHGPDPKNPDQLGYALIVFPKPDGRSCLDISINLMARYDGTVSEPKPFREEIIPETLPDFGIRTDLPNESEDGA